MRQEVGREIRVYDFEVSPGAAQTIWAGINKSATAISVILSISPIHFKSRTTKDSVRYGSSERLAAEKCLSLTGGKHPAVFFRGSASK